MFDSDEIRWVKSSANELNNLLQVISESSSFLESVCPRNADSVKYLDMIRNGVDRAVQVTNQMLERARRAESAGAQAGGAQAPAAAPDIFQGRLKPAAPAPAAPGPQPKAETSAPSSDEPLEGTGERELILIVDDEEFVTQLAQRVLADEGYRVLTAKDGFECLNLYRRMKDQVSLIILDFTMPIMDGSEVFDELRLINPRVAVVLSSGFAEQDKLRGMLAKGLRGFIPKPYTQQKLLLQVRSTLDALRTE